MPRTSSKDETSHLLGPYSMQISEPPDNKQRIDISSKNNKLITSTSTSTQHSTSAPVTSSHLRPTRGTGAATAPTIQSKQLEDENSTDESGGFDLSSKLIELLGENAVLIFTSTLLLLTAIANSIFFKKMTNSMTNYPWFLAQLSTIVYVPVFFSLVYMNYDNITPEMRSFPKYKFFVMGAFDALSGILSLFGGVHTSGSLQALLSNAIIPFTMVLAFFWVKESFSRGQILGATVIMIGVSCSMIPTFTGQDGGSSSGSNPLFVTLFVLNNLPSAVSSVYKEVAFNDADMDVNYLQAWVALWQLIFGFVLIPFNTFDFLGADKVELAELPSAFHDGLLCLFGYNTITLPRCQMPYSPFADGTSEAMSRAVSSALPICDTCTGAWIPVVLYLAFNMLYNYFMIVVIKHGGASLMYVIMTLRLPLVQIAFSLPSINSPPDVFGVYALLGLSLILLGLGVYRYGEAETEDDDDGDAESETLDDIDADLPLLMDTERGDCSGLMGSRTQAQRAQALAQAQALAKEKVKTRAKTKGKGIGIVTQTAIASGTSGNLNLHGMASAHQRKAIKNLRTRTKKNATQIRNSYYSKLDSLTRQNTPAAGPRSSFGTPSASPFFGANGNITNFGPTGLTSLSLDGEGGTVMGSGSGDAGNTSGHPSYGSYGVFLPSGRVNSSRASSHLASPLITGSLSSSPYLRSSHSPANASHVGGGSGMSEFSLSNTHGPVQAPNISYASSSRSNKSSRGHTLVSAHTTPLFVPSSAVANIPVNSEFATGSRSTEVMPVATLALSFRHVGTPLSRPSGRTCVGAEEPFNLYGNSNAGEQRGSEAGVIHPISSPLATGQTFYPVYFGQHQLPQKPSTGGAHPRGGISTTLSSPITSSTLPSTLPTPIGSNTLLQGLSNPISNDYISCGAGEGGNVGADMDISNVADSIIGAPRDYRSSIECPDDTFDPSGFSFAQSYPYANSIEDSSKIPSPFSSSSSSSSSSSNPVGISAMPYKPTPGLVAFTTSSTPVVAPSPGSISVVSRRTPSRQNVGRIVSISTSGAVLPISHPSKLSSSLSLDPKSNVVYGAEGRVQTSSSVSSPVGEYGNGQPGSKAVCNLLSSLNEIAQEQSLDVENVFVYPNGTFPLLNEIDSVTQDLGNLNATTREETQHVQDVRNRDKILDSSLVNNTLVSPPVLPLSSTDSMLTRVPTPVHSGAEAPLDISVHPFSNQTITTSSIISAPARNFNTVNPLSLIRRNAKMGISTHSSTSASPAPTPRAGPTTSQIHLIQPSIETLLPSDSKINTDSFDSFQQNVSEIPSTTSGKNAGLPLPGFPRFSSPIVVQKGSAPLRHRLYTGLTMSGFTPALAERSQDGDYVLNIENASNDDPGIVSQVNVGNLEDLVETKTSTKDMKNEPIVLHRDTKGPDENDEFEDDGNSDVDANIQFEEDPQTPFFVMTTPTQNSGSNASQGNVTEAGVISNESLPSVTHEKSKNKNKNKNRKR